MYSDLHPVIFRIYDSSEEGAAILTSNMEYLCAHIRDRYCESRQYGSELYGHVLKLSDHVSLEVQRIVDADDVQTTLENYRTLCEDLEATLGETRDKIGKLQSETVVILGIFAAIVMAFSGGITFLGASLEGMSSTGPYKIAFVVLICGIVLFNLLAYLLDSINSIVSELHSEEMKERLIRMYNHGSPLQAAPDSSISKVAAVNILMLPCLRWIWRFGLPAGLHLPEAV